MQYVIKDLTHKNYSFPVLSQHPAENRIQYSQEHITFHNSLSGLHKHVSKDILPEDLGGTDGPIESDKIRESIMQFDDYFEEAKKVYDDNKDRC